MFIFDLFFAIFSCALGAAEFERGMLLGLLRPVFGAVFIPSQPLLGDAMAFWFFTARLRFRFWLSSDAAQTAALLLLMTFFAFFGFWGFVAKCP